MEHRIAAELLYESEATLRMVDDALDELRIGDAEQRVPRAHLTAVCSNFDADDDPGYDVPSELCVRTFWQIQELLDGVRQSRETLQALSGERRAAAQQEDGGGSEPSVDHALSLLDRLDSADQPASDAVRELYAELRRDLLGLLGRSEDHSGSSERLSAVALQLSEAEARLTRLAHVFETGEA